MVSLSGLLPSHSLPALAQSVRNQLVALTAQIQTAWNRQHDADGAHGHVTAASLFSSDAVQAARFGFRPDPFSHGSGVPRGMVYVPAALLPAVSTIVAPLEFAGIDRAGVFILTHGAAVRIDGWNDRGRAIGDLIALVNLEFEPVTLRLASTSWTLSSGRFAGHASVPNGDVTLSPGRWVWALCMPVSQSDTVNRRWYLHHF